MNKETKVATMDDDMITPVELAELGDGEVAYIRELSSAQATKLYPRIDGIPKGINVFALHAADGRPIALTDSLQSALEQAEEDELAVASLH